MLTTRTADWFVSRGFLHAGAASESALLPNGNHVVQGRGSQLYVRSLLGVNSPEGGGEND